MKKLAIGCGVALLVLIVALAAGGYFMWARYIQPMGGAITEFAQIGEIEKQVRNTSSFTAPESGELSEELLGRFVAVQQAIETKLGDRMTALKAKYEELDRTTKGERRKASFSEVMSALKDLSSTVVAAKRVQVQALNDAGFSVEEYEWVRQQVYAAVGVAAGGFDLKDLQKLGGEAGDAARASADVLERVPERNKQLVAPYEKKLREWAALAYFGL